jgi:hypothetical protein
MEVRKVVLILEKLCQKKKKKIGIFGKKFQEYFSDFFFFFF